MTGAASAFDGLTRREREIAAAAASGAPAHELAAQLFLSPRTVETHLIRIYRKLGLRSRAELVALVLRDRREEQLPPESQRESDAPEEARPQADGPVITAANEVPLLPPRRKIVTLLRCSLADFTELVEGLDPEVFQRLIDRFYGACALVAERHQGTIDTSNGDAVLLVFGVPVAREDDALRAVRAAQDIHFAVSELSADALSSHGVRLDVRIGVNTGEAFVGASRPGAPLAVGEALNTAYRLSLAAAPGETVMGEITHRLVGEWVSVGELRTRPERGDGDGARSYRLLSLSDQKEATPRAAFVGRRPETAVLEQALARVTDTQSSFLVTIVGDAGLGKTRLVTEFLAGLGNIATVLQGRCLSYGDGITFWPVVEIIRAACGLDGSEQPDDVAARLGELTAGHTDAAAIHAQLIPLLVASGEPGSAGDVIRAVVNVIEHIAVREAVVVCIDDVHWAEPVLLDLLETLLQRCRDLPVLAIVEARPEFLSSRPTWGSTTVNTATLRMETLPAADAVALVAAFADLPDEVAFQVVAAGGGNPLYLEQLAVHASNTRGELVVPPTLTALLTARLDQLEAGDRALVSDASVIGQAFRVEEIAALSGADPSISDRLERLSERQIVRRDRSRRGGYRFQHVLVQQAAYYAQPKTVRAQTHRSYANWLTEHPAEAGGELSALCGWHLEQAHALLFEMSPGDVGNGTLAHQAAEALRDASRAREGADPMTAVNFLRRATVLTGDRHTKLRMLLRLAYLEMLFSFSLTAITGTLAEAEALIRKDHAERALLLQMRLCHRLMTNSDVPSDGDPEIADIARAATADAGWLWGQAASARLAVTELQVAGAWSAMLPLIDECIDFAEAERERHMRNEALRFRATILRWGPTPVNEAVSLLLQTLSALKDEPEERDRVQMELAVLYAYTGDKELARATLPEAPPSTSTASYLHWAFTGGAIDEALGDEASAAQILCGAGDVMSAQGDAGYSSTLYGWGAALWAIVGDVERARTMAEMARSTSPEHDSMSQAEWRLAAALVAAQGRDTATVDRMVHEALPYIDADDSPHTQGDRYRYAAVAFQLIGRRDEAAKFARHALELYRRKGACVFERRCADLFTS